MSSSGARTASIFRWLIACAAVILMGFMIWFSGGRREVEMWREVSGQVSGVSWRVQFHGVQPEVTEEVVRNAVLTCLDRVMKALSRWDEDSEVSCWNRLAAPRRMKVSPEFRAGLSGALRVAEESAGAYDPTFRGSQPGSHGLLEWEGDELVCARAVSLDLTSVMEGVFLDEASASLSGLGLNDFLVSWGGEYAARGDGPGGDGWLIGWEEPDPSRTGTGLQEVRLHDEAWSVSGNYRDFQRDASGNIVSGLVDARTGRGMVSDRFFSAGVRDASAVRADAWATACAILGEGEAWRLGNGRVAGLAFRSGPVLEKTP